MASQMDVLREMLLKNKGEVITYKEMESTAKVETRQELYQLKYLLRSMEFMDIRVVRGEGFLYRGSQLE